MTWGTPSLRQYRATSWRLPFASDRIDLSWTPSYDGVGVDEYRILRDGSPVGTASGPSYSDTGLSPNTAYSYEVVAADAAGNASAPSTAVTATTPDLDTESPTTPALLTATPTFQSVSLSWQASTDNVVVAGYTLTRNGLPLATLTSSATSYFDQVVASDTTYAYELIAFDGEGNTSTPAQIGATTLSPPAGLWAAYGFEDTGSTIADSSPFGHDGTLATPAVVGSQGHFGGALELNGVAGHVDLGTLDIPSDQMTIMAWVNADDFGTNDARIISKSTSSASADHIWMLSTIYGPHTRMRLETAGGVPTTTLIGNDGTLSAGTWHHVAATYDGTTMRLFQDGVPVGTTPRTGSIAQDPTVAVFIGANPGQPNQVFDGRIDDVKIFTRALSPSELLEQMTIPVLPSVVDTEPPVITLLGDDPQIVVFGDSYAEAGATATDSIDGDRTPAIVIDPSDIVETTPGTYVVSYNVSDLSGNPAEEVLRTVKVVSPPAVSITAPSSGLTVPEGTPIDFAASVTDVQDDDATLQAALAWSSNTTPDLGTGGSFSTTLPVGLHIVTASVTDADGEVGEDSVTVTVEAVLDLPPAAPTNLVAVPGDGVVDLSWDANTEADLTGYNVYRSEVPASIDPTMDTPLGSVPAGLEAYQDNTVANGTTYFYVVTAIDDDPSESVGSSEAFSMPQAPGGSVTVAVDNAFEVFVNGVSVGSGSDWYHGWCVPGGVGGR